MGTADDWIRVSPGRPCPICDKPDWCGISSDGSVVRCMREQSDHPSGDGWIHRLTAPAERNGQAHHSVIFTGPIVRHPLKDAGGAVVAVHCRRPLTRDGVPDKKVWWEQPNGTPSLKGTGLTPVGLPLYGVDALADADLGATVFVCEGEKATDAVLGLGLLAVGTVTGAKSVPDDAVLRVLVPYEAVLWPDNDDDGRYHMAKIADRLVALGGRVRVISWSGAPPKGDAADFVQAGLGLDDLRAMYREARVLVKGKDAPAGVVLHRLSDLQPETVKWLWRGRVPFAKLTVLDGDPGLGKSTMTLDIAARVTRGELMPDGSMGDRDGPRSVLLLSAEDGVRDTVLPRLAALGADLGRVLSLEEVPGPDSKGQMPAIPRDLEIIESLIRDNDVGLVVVDPLIAFLGDSSETNTWRDQDIRRALGPAAAMLERTGAAMLMVRHLNKGSGTGNPIYRGGGSIGIIGAARSGLLVSKDPDDDTGLRRILAPTKANLSAPAKALAYRMESADNGSVTVVWLGETDHTAVGLLAEPLPADERGALNDAIEFLRGELYGNPVLASEIKRRAREADVSPRTLTRARAKLNVIAERLHGPTGPWSLRLPVLEGTDAAARHGADA